MGAEENGGDEPVSWLALLIVFLPVILLVLWMVLFTRKSGALKQGSFMAKAGEQMEREREHSERMERKTDRMIELLESIDHKLNERP